MTSDSVVVEEGDEVVAGTLVDDEADVDEVSRSVFFETSTELTALGSRFLFLVSEERGAEERRLGEVVRWSEITGVAVVVDESGVEDEAFGLDIATWEETTGAAVEEALGIEVGMEAFGVDGGARGDWEVKVEFRPPVLESPIFNPLITFETPLDKAIVLIFVLETCWVVVVEADVALSTTRTGGFFTSTTGLVPDVGPAVRGSRRTKTVVERVKEVGTMRLARDEGIVEPDVSELATPSTVVG